MAIITGLTGSVTLPNGISTFISSITLSGGPALLETPSYGGSGWMTRVAALKDLSGQAVCFLSGNPFAFDGATGSMTVQYKSGCYITFTAVTGQVTVVGEYAGLNIVTFNFSNAADVNPVVGWS